MSGQVGRKRIAVRDRLFQEGFDGLLEGALKKEDESIAIAER